MINATGMKLNPEVKTAWLAALRSGKYTQTDGVLKAINAVGRAAHCCLGVLCEVVGSVENWKHAPGLRTKDDTVILQYEGAAGFPPPSVLEAAGIPGDTGSHPFWWLADMNDIGMSFAKIADEIEVKF